MTVRVALPELVIVNVTEAVRPVVTLPNVRLPLTPMIFVDGVAVATPVPEAERVPVPLVASLLTVTVLV